MYRIWRWLDLPNRSWLGTYQPDSKRQRNPLVFPCKSYIFCKSPTTSRTNPLTFVAWSWSRSCTHLCHSISNPFSQWHCRLLGEWLGPGAQEVSVPLKSRYTYSSNVVDVTANAVRYGTAKGEWFLNVVSSLLTAVPSNFNCWVRSLSSDRGTSQRGGYQNA